MTHERRTDGELRARVEALRAKWRRLRDERCGLDDELRAVTADLRRWAHVEMALAGQITDEMTSHEVEAALEAAGA